MDSKTPTPQSKMTPEQQRLTFEMARGLQETAARQYLDDGWSLAERHDEAARETPLVKSFDRLDSEQKKPYFDTAANAVMQLLDDGFSLAPSQEPEMPLPLNVRKAAEEALMRGGRTLAEAQGAVDAIEAAGFSIGMPVNRSLQKMEAFYEMSMTEMDGDMHAAITATKNMALRSGFPVKEINAFLTHRNDELMASGSSLEKLLTTDDVVRWKARDLTREYDKAYASFREQAAARGAAVAPDGRLLDEAEHALAAKRATEKARGAILGPLYGIKDEGLREGVIAILEQKERSLLGGREETAPADDRRWAATLGEARKVEERMLEMQEKHAEAVKRWKALRWYEKVFVPRPLPMDQKAMQELQQEHDALLERCRREFNESVEGRRAMRLEDGTVVKIGMQVADGRPSLTLALDRDGVVETTQRLFLADGSFTELTAAVQMQRTAKMAGLAKEAELVTMATALRRFESMTQTVEREMDRSRDPQRQEQRIREEPVVSLRQAYEAYDRAMDASLTRTEERRQVQEQAEKAERQRVQKKEDDEWMPSLHPNLAGDISQKDVDILMAFRFNGGKKEDVQSMIDSLKEKKQIVYTGYITYRPAEGYDGARYIPVKHVAIGLRVGSDGRINVYNPNTGKDMGPIRKALASPSLNSARKPSREAEKQKKQQKKKEDNPKIRFNA